MFKRIMVGIILLAILGAGIFYYHRAQLLFTEIPPANLPAAQMYQSHVPTSSTDDPAKIFPSPINKGQRSVSAVVSSIDPLAWTGPLPASVNLAVPFLVQAPTGNWALPYQEACEEASIIMVNAFYHHQTAAFTPTQGNQAILNLLAFEQTINAPQDLTAVEVADIVEKNFGYKNVLVRPVTNAADIKRALANGYPVILPENGKTLGNPHFHNGGPKYHMLVVKGYVGDQYWITDDPGTKYGLDYTYPISRLLDSNHDWNGGDVPNGQPLMIVVLPNS